MPLYGSIAEKRVAYDRIYSSLWSERQSGFDSHWRDLSDYILPRRARFWTGDRNKGDKRNQNIIDSTARFSARTLASGLHAGLTSPARPWMKLTTPNQDLAKRPGVKRWLAEVTDRMLTMFATTNLYNVLPTVYGDLGVFGTAAMSIVDDSRDLFRCYAYPIGSFALGMDQRGLVTTFVREYELTVRQIVQQFGLQPNGSIDWTNISTHVRSLWERNNYEVGIRVVWLVKPNDDPNPRKLAAKYLPWTSCHFEAGGINGTAASNTPEQSTAGAVENKFLRESGFRVFPIMAPRWDVTGEDSYGTDCPGMTALGDIRQLQQMQKKKAQGIAKQVDPPLQGPTSLRTQKTSLLPGDITYVDVREGMHGLRPIHEVGIQLRDMTADIAQVQYRIQRSFYEDLFLMLARSDESRGAQPPTAREIDERHEEKLLALGPVLERTNDELLDPIVDRVYEMMDVAGLIPPPPPELQGVKLKVEYISILSQAQKLVGVVGQDRFLQSVQALAQSFPEVRHKVDAFRAVNNYADMLGVDPSLVRSDADAQADLQKDQQMAQAAQSAKSSVDAARAAKLASDTSLTGDSALQRLIAGSQGANGQQPFPSPASPNPVPVPSAQ
jgi:hypothetical protein